MEQRDVEIIDITGLSLASSNSPTRESSCERSKNASLPWYSDQRASHPFALAVKCKARFTSALAFTGVEFFPWGRTPLEDLWSGNNLIKTDAQFLWRNMRTKWKDVMAVCGGRVVRLIQTTPQQQGAPVFQISLPADCLYTISHAKWALNPRNLHPLILYTHSSVLHIFDVEMCNFLGCIRGHGADITSLAVHPVQPHIVCTTSRDFTTRIYDFRVISDQEKTRDSQKNRERTSGRTKTNDSGNSGIGKCVILLTGGRSGGHEAAVLGAGFHPSLPLIATCGMDHAVRIWYLKPQLFIRDEDSIEIADNLSKEDKPLFSSTLIHDARVFSVHWLSFDLLVSHSASPMRPASGRPETDSGTLAVWQWLSIRRFFPPQVPIYRDPPLRGCISDYRESSSFKIISLSKLSNDALRLSVHRQQHGPPLILFNLRSKVMILNSSQLPPRNRPVLQDDQDCTVYDDAAHSGRIHFFGTMAENMCTDLEGWTVNVGLGEDLEDEEIEQCALSSDFRRVAAVGSREGVWMWNDISQE